MLRSSPRRPLAEKYPIGGPRDAGVSGLGIAVLLLHIGVLLFGAIPAVAQGRALARAVPVQAVVLQSVLRTWQTTGRHGSTSTHYEPLVDYRYQVGGSPFVRDTVDLVHHTYARTEAQAAVAHFRAGSTVTAYIDPQHPGRSFLHHRCWPDPYLFIDLSIPCAIYGLLLLCTGIPASDPSIRSRRLAGICGYAITLGFLAALHYHASGGRGCTQMTIGDIGSALVCLWPLWIWLRLRPWGASRHVASATRSESALR